jgi:MYXO-CTERM domain-containing protein
MALTRPRLALVAALWLAPSVALADAALRPVPVDCRNIPARGQCVGSVIQTCDTTVTPNRLVQLDCTAEYGAAAQCVDRPELPGPTCVVPPGSPCLRLEASGTTVSVVCEGTSPGCVQGQTTSACTENLPRCQATDIGSCRADQLVLGCLDTQPWLLDCPAFGATCGAGVCVDADLGAVCGPNVLCAAPLVCGRLSRCEAAPDAGVSVDAQVEGDAAASGDDAATTPGDAAVGGDATSDDARASTPDGSPTPDGTTAPDAIGAGPDAGVTAADAASAADADISGLGTAEGDDCSCSTSARGSATSALPLLVVLGLVVRRARRRSSTER